MQDKKLLKTWVEIKERAVANNVAVFRSLLRPGVRMYAVVKSNAYGHGLRSFSKLADRYGVDGFCVDSVREGISLRSERIRKSILVLGPTLPGLLKIARANAITVSISNWAALKALVDTKSGATYQIKLDTGMHRQGFPPEEIPKVIRFIGSHSLLRKNITGIFTHFASAKDIAYPSYTHRQMRSFEESRNLFHAAGLKTILAHASATGGTALYPKAHYDAVRIGIGLYGYWPSREAEIQHAEASGRSVRLLPVLSWRARVSEMKALKAGDYVGYDLSEKIRKSTQAAIIPVGYWHGIPRSLSSRGTLLLNGKRGKFLGRVSMDLVVADFGSRTRFRTGDSVTLIGRDGREEITAEEFAEQAGTISYEVLTRLNPLMERIIV